MCVHHAGVFRATRMRLNPRQRAVHALFKTYIDVVHVGKEEGDKLFKQRTGVRTNAAVKLDAVHIMQCIRRGHSPELRTVWPSWHIAIMRWHWTHASCMQTAICAHSRPDWTCRHACLLAVVIPEAHEQIILSHTDWLLLAAAVG